MAHNSINQQAGSFWHQYVSARENGIQVFISPHYFYPTDHGWRFEGALEALMHEVGMLEGWITTSWKSRSLSRP